MVAIAMRSTPTPNCSSARPQAQTTIAMAKAVTRSGGISVGTMLALDNQNAPTANGPQPAARNLRASCYESPTAAAANPFRGAISRVASLASAQRTRAGTAAPLRAETFACCGQPSGATAPSVRIDRVAISNHTRKVLWSLSGNACARCDTPLVRAPEAVGDVHAIVGRECHIVAQAAAGPRGAAGTREDLDSYENLILLCANCHAVVDMQLERFPPAELRRLKVAHEQRVARRTAPGLPDIRLRGRGGPMELLLVSSGDGLIDILGPSLSCVYDRPDELSPSQRELLGDFFQSCQDWGDIYGDIGPKGHLDAGQDLQNQIDALNEQGLLVYAATRNLTLTGGERETPWLEAAVKVVHARDARQTVKTPTGATAT